MIRRVLATVGVSALLVTSIYAPGGAQDADVAAAGVNWSACPPVAEGQPSLADFECATVKVPLNYNKPAGRKITLGMVKHPATSGTSRGTIFFNPGGPSDQGSVFLPALVDGFGKRIVSNYDLVSWDPRGMGGMSTPVVQCFPSLEKEEKFLAPAPFPPLNKQEMQKWGSLHSKMFTKCGKGDVALLQIAVDDEGHTAQWLRSGQVLAAVTATEAPAAGCNCLPLGAMRYVAAASPAFLARHFPQGIDTASLALAPSLMFNAKDELQQRWVEQHFGTTVPMPRHTLPSSQAFVAAALGGLGWAMHPHALVREHLNSGALVKLKEDSELHVPLYWQHARMASSLIQNLTRAVVAAADGALVKMD